MDKKEMIREELTELLDTYYNGSFALLVSAYIYYAGISQKEVEALQEAMKRLENVRLINKK